MNDKLIVSTPPHVYKHESVNKIMWMVTFSLLPAGVAGVFIFGMRALSVIILGVASALVTEWLIGATTKRKASIFDAGALLTGLLLAYNLSPAVPLWIPVVGSFAAIAVGKLLFGGLGQNVFNPALVGRVFLMASWPKYMTAFSKPFEPALSSLKSLNLDAISAATPLSLVKESKLLDNFNYWDLFLGVRGGCIGEVCIIALVLGALFLILRGYISLHIPFSFIITTCLLSFIFAPALITANPAAGGVISRFFQGDWLFHALNGGLILGAFFMATDYVTSPLTRKGQVIFGIGCGLLTVIIRLWGGYPEGVSYAILMMNAATPLIDRFNKNRVYGRIVAKR